MAIITLTTDFGEKDYYAGALKGAIYSELGSVNLIDITHSVSPFNTYQAAYLLRNSYKHFPKGTVHLIGVDTERTLENTPMLQWLLMVIILLGRTMESYPC